MQMQRERKREREREEEEGVGVTNLHEAGLCTDFHHFKSSTGLLKTKTTDSTDICYKIKQTESLRHLYKSSDIEL